MYLSGIKGVDLQRSADTQAALEAAGVVVSDVAADHLYQGLPAGKAPAVVTFPLEDAPEALHGPVVNALAYCSIQR